MKGRNSTVCNLVSFCSEPLSELNKPRHSPPNRQPFPANHCTPAREASLSSDVLHYLKTQQRGGGWRVGFWEERERERETMVPLSLFYCDFFPPSHSLIPLMKSVQAEACSRRQQFCCTICASHIGWQGGEGSVGSAARREARERK